MKQCPNCKGLELYDDAETNCPYCGTGLVRYERQNGRTVGDTRYANDEPVTPRSRREGRTRAADTPEFVQQAGRKYSYRGRVVSISPTSRFMSRFEKWFNAVFRGLPYQIGNPVYETNIRIEEIKWSRIPEQAQNLAFYGDPGELDVGDDVSVTAVRKNNRYVVKNITINDVNGSVRMRGLVPAALIRAITLCAVLLIVVLTAGIVSFFSTGGFWTLLGAIASGIVLILSKIIAALAPIIILVIVFWLLIKGRR